MADSNGYAYNPEEIDNAASVLMQKSTDFGYALNDMAVAVRARIEEWKGMSKEAFEEKLTEIRDNLHDINYWLKNDAVPHLKNMASGVEEEDAGYSAEIANM
ncbi:WXG100 family type VII secretion target [Streptomyces sp. NPDC056632]|uniref:WXG100 family type VII secretion target n=1 Tax=Streptomyces sp. NPDC056632 TaxID=3345884 RepID=UPI0036AB59F1